MYQGGKGDEGEGFLESHWREWIFIVLGLFQRSPDVRELTDTADVGTR